MWNMDGFGIDILPCVMSERRFLFLLEAIRFDGIRGRNVRKQGDKITHIRKVFENFVGNCKNT